MTNNEARICFSVGGYNFNPEDVTRLLDIDPTTIVNGNTQMGAERPAISSWELSSDKSLNDDIDVIRMVNDLIKVIEPKKDKLLLAIDNFNLVPKIVIKLSISAEDVSIPEISFGSRAVKFLASIGAFIDVETHTS